ncbi:luciferase [freshwater metagenome]|jgi:probable LLM family oxidoreductase|uniref:Luciferase n=1 Tax=freshwater metagenome TaxID=449393 RepID=A0A094QB63_9ZZZZ
MTAGLEFGLDTFGDATVAPDGTPLSHAQVIRNVIAEGVLADQVGLNFIGIGEHHREDFAVSAPEVVMAAIAARTQNIHVGSAVTVLSSDDPIRVYQRFSEVNALSDGRAEVILGRGSFTESFPLFGYELSDYETLFEEKLDLFVEILKEQPVTWSGSFRPALSEQRIFPPIETGRLKAWIGVGGSPQSVVRAARYGLPLMLAIIGGDPLRFRPYVDLYHRALTEMGKEILPVGQHSPGFVAATDAEARELAWPHFRDMHTRIGAERGWPPFTRAQFDAEAGAEGALMVGSPQTVAQKIARSMTGLGVTRFDLKYSLGTLGHENLMECIRLYGTEVVPLVRELVARAAKAA